MLFVCPFVAHVENKRMMTTYMMIFWMLHYFSFYSFHYIICKCTWKCCWEWRLWVWTFIPLALYWVTLWRSPRHPRLVEDDNEAPKRATIFADVSERHEVWSGPKQDLNVESFAVEEPLTFWFNFSVKTVSQVTAHWKLRVDHAGEPRYYSISSQEAGSSEQWMDFSETGMQEQT